MPLLVKKILERIQTIDKWFWLFFGIFLSFQVYWRTFPWWDPSVFALNGKWFCGEKIYFEFLRPPLSSFLHCVFGANDISPFLVVIVSCLVYFIGLILFFDKYTKTEKISAFYFSAFAFLFPTILIHSNAGGDILALGLFLIAYSVEGTFSKGLFFGLSTLSRYNYFFFLPILFFQKKWKQWPLLLVAIFLMWSPWLYYNFSQAGDPFFSVSESAILNIQQKGVFEPLSLIDVGFLSFFGLSIIVAFFSNALSRLPLGVGALTILQYLASGVKETRFSIPLVPMQALFLSRIHARFPKWKWVVASLLLFSVAVDGNFIQYFYAHPYSVDVPNDYFLHNCRVLSDRWVDFYGEGIIAEPLAPSHDWVSAVNNGNYLVIYDREKYAWNKLSSFETINRGGYLIVKSPACARPKPFFVSTVWRG